MPAAPPAPLRPHHRHTPSSSSIEYSLASPGAAVSNNYSGLSPGSPPSPRFSSPPSPTTPRPHQDARATSGGDHRMSGDFSTTPGADGGGLGSLADELADAWEEEEGYEYASGAEIDVPETLSVNGAGNSVTDLDNNMRGTERGGGSVTPPAGRSPDRQTLQLPSLKQRPRNGHIHSRHHRRQESQYDGSDYGNDSDLEETADISPGLKIQMAEIESLARRGMENNGSEHDHIIMRAVEALRDLGGQSGIENSAMRLITAHTSIASHLAHQTRTLQTLTHPLLFSPFPILSADAIDALIPLIDEGLLTNLPYPFPGRSPQQQQQQQQPPSSISSRPNTPSSSVSQILSFHALISQTTDLTHTLRGLNDTLYESRQLTSTASRRLRSARELVAELRRDDEGREEGTRWIEKGDWDRRLREREAQKVCGEVVRGFEAVCGEWRKKILRSGGSSSAAAAA